MVLFPVSVAKLDHGSVSRCNFAGDEKAGGSWTDKIMARKEETAGGGAGGEGAEEDEWVSSPLISPVSKYYYLFYFLLLLLLRRTESTSPSPGSPPGLQLS